MQMTRVYKEKDYVETEFIVSSASINKILSHFVSISWYAFSYISELIITMDRLGLYQ